MKLHLPVRLLTSVLVCLFSVYLTVGSGIAWADLTLSEQGSVNIDYSDSSSVPDVGGELHLLGGTQLNLENCDAGDGRAYTLFTGISELVDARGNTITLDSTNNPISNYFDTTRPGTGFWAGATLELSSGELRLIRYTEITTPVGYNISVPVDELVDVTNCQDSTDDILLQINSSQQTNKKLVIDSPNASLSTTSSGSRHFTSESIQALASLSFCNSTAQLFNVATGKSLVFSHLKELCFEGNESTENGSVIHTNNSSAIIFNNIGAVLFQNNSITKGIARGGVISGEDDGTSSVTIINCGAVSFECNSVLDKDIGLARGGAIAIRDTNNLNLEKNATITFSNNSASSDESTTSESGYAFGGAISIDDEANASISNNGVVLFQQNKVAATATDMASTRGGAIATEISSNLNVNRNRQVTFTENSANASGYTSKALGGAISCNGSDTENFTPSCISISGNGSVLFRGNLAQSYSSGGDGEARGGAIYTDNSNLTLNDNGSVIFNGNSAYAQSGYSSGGAIYGGWGSTITLSKNGCVMFTENSSTHDGGAISGEDSIVLIQNGSVLFSGNKVYGSSADDGGAIRGKNITLCDNESLIFSRNSTTGTSSSSGHGGAIYVFGNLQICNNDSALFEKNAEVTDGLYRLRSIYATSGDNTVFSAVAGKSIEFKDSIYIGTGGTLNLNANYSDLEQKGDLIFSGATTVDNLYEVKGNVSGTEEEIRLSRTSEVNTLTNLYGGRLRVEDGSIYQGQGITVHEGSEATVRVKDAELNHSGYALEFNNGTALEVAGNSTIRGNVNLKEGSLFKLEQAASLSLHETVEADAATLTVNGGALLEGGASLNASLTLADGATLDMDALDAGAVTLNGALTFGGQVTMGDKLLGILSEMGGWEESVTLFTGLTNLVLPAVAADDAADRLWVGDVFSNLAGNENYYFNYVPEVGSLSVVFIPEPATATLSLLALAALAARRRRK